jgi:hypothetical protein
VGDGWDVGRITVTDSDGKIKALPSLGAFCSSGQWVMAAFAGGGLLALFENSSMISMPFAPSRVAFG